ncbi:hypothetical protein [Streptomyces sp. G-G2]|uniref:hypothetical protein n=1 Tax=Streptomyces sp. G-G2 TaxID=3046201 RepID=UPI0024B8A43F|nr:hypothetical protein [Streptomyces sp. G-G2]MDJ0381792.1 hypothetical protein [Streptomyces sp. G-G2]
MSALGAAAASGRYLAEAADAGLLHRVRGLRYVAGMHHDPLLDERRFLVEYGDEELLADPQWLAGLVDQALGEDPRAASVVVRAPASVPLDDPWRRELSYLYHPAGADAPATGTDAGSGLRVRPAEPSEEEAVADWLVRAMVHGSADLGTTADPAVAGQLARECLAAPGRHSYVVCLDGRAVGHATLLCDAEDEVTDRRAVELVDLLVDLPEGPRREAATALTAAALAHARRLELPLLGHVVHPSPRTDADPGARIVASLRSRGWEADHVFWRRPTGSATDSPSRSEKGAA